MVGLTIWKYMDFASREKKSILWSRKVSIGSLDIYWVGN